jgi:inward rectifier potassium channel
VLANVLVTAEALFGLLAVAMATGLMFAKFSRPTARVLFSRWAVVAPYDGVPCLMFRMANARGNNIVHAQLQVVLARQETTLEGDQMRRFHDLVLLRPRSTLFSFSWTAIHPITEASPFHGATPAALVAAEAEIVVSLMGYDENLAQTVHARHRYQPGDVAWGARFVDILVREPGGMRRIDYARFHDVVPLAAAGPE